MSISSQCADDGTQARLTTARTAAHSPLSPDHAALVVVDIQNDFCHRKGTMGRSGKQLSAIEEAVGKVELLVELSRDIGVPVIFVKTLHGRDVDSVEWLHRYPDSVEKATPSTPPNCVEGTWGADFYRITPRLGEFVAVKHRYSAFSAPGFRTHMEALGRRSLIFTGVTTNVCVESSLRSAVDNDFLGTIVEDASAAYAQAEHTAAIAGIANYFGRTITTGKLAGRWNKTRRTA